MSGENMIYTKALWQLNGLKIAFTATFASGSPLMGDFVD